MKSRWLIWLLAVIVIGLGAGAFVMRDTLFIQSQITKYTSQLNVDPNNFDAAFGLASAYFKTKQYAKSVDFYVKATQIRPTSAESFNNLGNAYRKLSRLEDAEKVYLQAIELSPTYITAYTNLTNLYELWGKSASDKLKEIPKVLEQGIAKNPQNPVLIQAIIDYYKKAQDEASTKKYQKLLDSL